MGEFTEAEVTAAFEQYLDAGARGEDWPRWASLFTEDALYEEHFLGTMHGRGEIEPWIIGTMAEYRAMSLWVDWYAVDGDLVALYIWNNLPDPMGEGRRFGFPNTTLLRYAGDNQWSWEADFYNPADATRVWLDWFEAGGRNDTPPDRTLQGIADWAPAVPEPAFPRDELEREFEAYRERGRIAVATGDWDQWADQFTDDARYYEHHYGKFAGQAEIRAWITGVMKPFPTMEFPLACAVFDGNRISALIPNVLPDPSGGAERFAFDVNIVLHYAGGGKWSYEEDLYNPKEAEAVIMRWVKAGGVVGD